MGILRYFIKIREEYVAYRTMKLQSTNNGLSVMKSLLTKAIV